MKVLSPPTAAALAVVGGAAFVLTGAAGPSAASPTTVTLQPAASTATAPESGTAAATPPGSTPPAEGAKAGHKKGALSGRGLHADFVVKGRAGTFITAASQRGQVTAVSPTAITLKSDDGFTRSYVIVTGTKVSQDHAQVDLAAVTTGAKASVVAVKNADGYDVRHISLPKS